MIQAIEGITTPPVVTALATEDTLNTQTLLPSTQEVQVSNLQITWGDKLEENLQNSIIDAVYEATNDEPHLSPMAFQEIEKNISQGNLIVALEGNEIAGFITTEKIDSNLSLLKGLYICPNYRRSQSSTSPGYGNLNENEKNSLARNSLGFKLFEYALNLRFFDNIVFETTNSTLKRYASLAGFQQISSYHPAARRMGIREFIRNPKKYLSGTLRSSEYYAIFYLDRNHNYEFEV